MNAAIFATFIVVGIMIVSGAVFTRLRGHFRVARVLGIVGATMSIIFSLVLFSAFLAIPAGNIFKGIALGASGASFGIGLFGLVYTIRPAGKC